MTQETDSDTPLIAILWDGELQQFFMVVTGEAHEMQVPLTHEEIYALREGLNTCVRVIESSPPNQLCIH